MLQAKPSIICCTACAYRYVALGGGVCTVVPCERFLQIHAPHSHYLTSNQLIWIVFDLFFCWSIHMPQVSAWPF